MPDPFLRLLRRNQKGVETAFSFLRMVLPETSEEKEKRGAILCTTTRGQNHRKSVLL